MKGHYGVTRYCQGSDATTRNTSLPGGQWEEMILYNAAEVKGCELLRVRCHGGVDHTLGSHIPEHPSEKS